MRSTCLPILITALAWSLNGTVLAQISNAPPAAPARGGPAPNPAPVRTIAPQYVLRPGDVVQVKVYQEEDLTTICRIGKEGAVTMPLLGSVKLASNSLAQATVIIHDLLAKDYLVNPQVTITVTEFGKRRFTVLGQVQRPGTFDMPADDTVSLLQAIAAAGGYTRIANAHKITVQRTLDAENKVIRLDAEAGALKKDEKPFEVRPDDVIIVGESWL